MNKKENVLVLGTGAREHALAWKLKQSPRVRDVYIAPKCLNSLTYAERKVDIPGALDDVQEVARFCVDYSIQLVVIGVEQPLCDGWVDALNALLHPHGVNVFGPSKEAARLEGSKSFAKEFMVRNGLPTAAYHTVTSLEEGIAIVEKNAASWGRFVLKEDGLCGGKGVSIANSKCEALEQLHQLFSKANTRKVTQLVIEEFLDGFELSAMCFTDGKTLRRLPLSQDHKRVGEGATGENTGGMGAVAPLTVALHIEEQIEQLLARTLEAMREAGTQYRGALYAGLMVNAAGKVNILEFNCRLGDPETEVLMRLLLSDLHPVLTACCRGTLHELEHIRWSSKKCMGIVLATKGYPAAKFPTGIPIEGLPPSSHQHTHNGGDGSGGAEGEVVVFHAGVRFDSKKGVLVNSSGRVLCVTNLAHSLFEAKVGCLAALETLRFDAAYYRRDIGEQWMTTTVRPLSYAVSGVNVDEGNRFVEEIKSLCIQTRVAGTGKIGGFGAILDPSELIYGSSLESVMGEATAGAALQLVVGMDGVGTKLELATNADKLHHIGYDLVGMCANDVLCHIARPMAFLDYYVTGKLDRQHAVRVVESIAKACLEAKCALVGGETAEMPGVYAPKQWDVAGCCIGVRMRPNSATFCDSSVREGCILLGLASNGLHSNGFSLVRHIVGSLDLTEATCPWERNTLLVDELLKPTKIYSGCVLPLFDLMQGISAVKAIAHITGGGLTENVPRILRKGFVAKIDCSTWSPQPIFHWIRQWGAVSSEEMLRTFNCGIGMVLAVAESQVSHVESILNAHGTPHYRVGEVVSQAEVDAKPRVIFTNTEHLFHYCFDREFITRKRTNVAILISGAGSNMLHLIEQSQCMGSHAHVRVVISNRADAGGIAVARSLGIETLVIPHAGLSREQFEQRVSSTLEERGVELICLAGFMRILSPSFVQRWQRRVINIHPSLLPAFRGASAVRLALEAGVKITGCSVHYAAEEVDAGEILAQEAVKVEDNDDERSLHEKIQEKEYYIYPIVMETLAKKMAQEMAKRG